MSRRRLGTSSRLPAGHVEWERCRHGRLLAGLVATVALVAVAAGPAGARPADVNVVNGPTPSAGNISDVFVCLAPGSGDSTTTGRYSVSGYLVDSGAGSSASVVAPKNFRPQAVGSR